MSLDTATANDVPFLDLSDPNFSMDSAEARAARAQSWYARTPYGLAVLRYEEMSKLLKNRKLRQGSYAWPEKNGVTDGLFHQFWRTAVINYEGPDHARLRRLHNPGFSPRLIDGLVPRFQALANELIDAFIDRGECDFVAEFAEPYAARVISILLGIPESEWKTIASWSSAVGLALTVTIRDDLDEIEKALAGLYGYADDLIADRTANPGDDFTTKLVQAARDESTITHDELRTALAHAIFAGMDTTRNQLSLALTTFIDHPDQWKLLAQRPELGRAAVEEVMRVAPTVTWVTREALEDFEFQGVHIAKGTTVHLLNGLAGTDDTDGAEVSFDITAERRPQLGFGGGMHHCLGHFVARSDMSEALHLLAQRLTSPRRLPGDRWLPDSGNTGPSVLPIAFTPGACAGSTPT
ncbi:cytochrome P450 [Mycolicibacterium confluentis]|uniref:Cytochrome P450 n=1 Tax=Mycolicibacterium confluentis TaxID=28047 RepID=A0A7I7Y388_9MYCO|nr:cytochrome P450 [Mycolicibacterium confluentis]MCV7318263.1 cytochrome P450 [Mycolicibacterium confluentis]BBZ36175.1 cytochrome P450 [Mycolicibacterium confluentis]